VNQRDIQTAAIGGDLIMNWFLHKGCWVFKRVR
jgi:hypothetical protein